MLGPVSLNARLGAIALVIGSGVQLAASVAGSTSAPWAFVGWLIFAFGAIGLCQELGPTRPLNRAGLILLAAAALFRAFVVLEPSAILTARAELAFALSAFGAMLFWSVALLHRKEAPRKVGIFGFSIAGGGVALLMSAHLAVGIAGIVGFVDLYDAIDGPEADYSQALVVVSLLLALWSLAVAWLLSTVQIQDFDRQATASR